MVAVAHLLDHSGAEGCREDLRSHLITRRYPGHDVVPDQAGSRVQTVGNGLENVGTLGSAALGPQLTSALPSRLAVIWPARR